MLASSSSSTFPRVCLIQSRRWNSDSWREISWEDYGNGPVTIKASFKDFATPYDCVEHLVTQWYKDYKGYKGVNRATSREDCAYLLKKEGYATDPIYSQKLIRLMEQHD